MLPFLHMLIISNWKAYVETKEKAKALYSCAQKLAKGGTHELVLAVPAPYIGLLAGGTQNVHIGAQDISVTLGGAVTGEVTAGLVSDLGATHVLVGHSERRAMGETNETIFAKVQHTLAHGLTPVLCIGESERDEDAGYLKVIRAELASVFSELTQKERMEVVVAYEPLWAIGKSAREAITAEDLREIVAYIRKVLGDYLPGKAPQKVKILYGGSIEAANAPNLSTDTGIDGFLVGHASTDVVSYTLLVKALS